MTISCSTNSSQANNFYYSYDKDIKWLYLIMLIFPLLLLPLPLGFHLRSLTEILRLLAFMSLTMLPSLVSWSELLQLHEQSGSFPPTLFSRAENLTSSESFWQQQLGFISVLIIFGLSFPSWMLKKFFTFSKGSYRARFNWWKKGSWTIGLKSSSKMSTVGSGFFSNLSSSEVNFSVYFGVKFLSKELRDFPT